MTANAATGGPTQFVAPTGSDECQLFGLKHSWMNDTHAGFRGEWLESCAVRVPPDRIDVGVVNLVSQAARVVS